MSTLDIERGAARMRRGLVVCALAALFCLLFSRVYAAFSYGESSAYMRRLYWPPLFGGVLPAAVLILCGAAGKIDRAAFNLWNAGVATVGAGCLLRGVVDISGRSTNYDTVYWIAGAALLLAALIIQLKKSLRRKDGGAGKGRWGRLAMLLALPLLLGGCRENAQTADVKSSGDPSAAPALATAVAGGGATPEPSPSPEPEMMIDEDGDITLRSDIAAAFSAQSYHFDEAPTVLIYHTHATEAFRKGEADDYEETERGRTEDTAYNIVGLGERLAEALKERGFTVLHDTSNVEPPERLSAYSRSLLLMQQYADVDIYLDLHRNASNRPGPSENTVLLEGEPHAKMFFVVGTGIGTYEGEYDALPDWKANYSFALSVSEALSDTAPELIKPIRLKVGRYNQHMGLCLLAEIGTNADTLEAAQNTVPLFADALKSVCIFP
ncbi:MAG: stage II sporulation protein P [Clostridia bacterium]|nr:stage II sporulation protein P [Clostridia bacterium]